MTTPTPDEITAALAVLRASGAVGNSTLDEIEAENNPTAPMVHTMRRELLSYFRSHGDVPDFGTLSDMLTHLAAESGLRITADLGEPIGYAIVENENTEVASYRVYSRADLEEARANAAKRRGGVVMALLPEGGQQ